MSYSESITSIVSPPEVVNGRSILSYAALLSVLLVIVVPIVAVTTTLPTLGLVVAAGVCYLFILVTTDNIFEGACSAIFVLITFAANVPLYSILFNGGQDGFALNIMLVDVVLFPLLALFAIWRRQSSQMNANISEFSISKLHSSQIASYAFVGLVIWSTLSAIVSNGPSRVAAVLFVVMQLRYLLLFIVAIQIMRHIELRNAIYAILIAGSFQLLFAIIQAINGKWFGLSYLGEASGGRRGYFFVGPIRFVEGVYPGGFTGTSRILVAVLLLLLPIFIEIIVRRRLLWKFCALICVLGSAIIARVSRSDASLGAFTLVTLLIASILMYFIITDAYQRDFTGRAEIIAGIFSSVGATVTNFVLFLGRTVQGPTTSPSSTLPNENPSGKSNMNDPTNNELPNISKEILTTLDSLPLISAKTLSIRLHQYIFAIEFGLRYPLFGLGGFNFALLSLSLGLPAAMEIHNIYLSFLAATGIPGALLFITAQVAVLYCAVKNTRAATDRILWAMIACGLIGFYAYSFWVAIQSGVAFMTYWTFAGVVVGASQQRYNSI